MEIIVIAVHMASYLRIKRKGLHCLLIDYPALIVKLAVPDNRCRQRPRICQAQTALLKLVYIPSRPASAEGKRLSKILFQRHANGEFSRFFNQTVCMPRIPHSYHEYRFVPDVAYGAPSYRHRVCLIPALYCQECSLFELLKCLLRIFAESCFYCVIAHASSLNQYILFSGITPLTPPLGLIRSPLYLGIRCM